MHTTLVQYHLDYGFRRPNFNEDGSPAAIFCCKTNHYFTRWGQDSTKYTFSFLCLDTSGKNRDYIHILEAMPVDTSYRNGLIRNIWQALSDRGGIEFARPSKVVLINGKTLPYNINSWKCPLVKVLPEIIPCSGISHEEFSQLEGLVKLPRITEEEFTRLFIKGVEEPPQIGCFI